MWPSISYCFAEMIKKLGQYYAAHRRERTKSSLPRKERLITAQPIMEGFNQNILSGCPKTKGINSVPITKLS